MSPTLKELEKKLAILKKLRKSEEKKIKLQRQIKELQPLSKEAMRRKRVGHFVKKKTKSFLGKFEGGILTS